MANCVEIKTPEEKHADFLSLLYQSLQEVVVDTVSDENSTSSDAVLAFVEEHLKEHRELSSPWSAQVRGSVEVEKSMEFTALHVCFTALSMSVSAKIISGDFPPSSRDTFLIFERAQLKDLAIMNWPQNKKAVILEVEESVKNEKEHRISSWN